MKRAAGAGRRWGRGLLRVLAIFLLSFVALLALLVASINLPWVRARIAQEISQRASEALAGSVAVTRIGQIGLGSVGGVDAKLLDPSGRPVLALSDANVDLDVSVLLSSLVEDTPLTLAFERIAISQLDVRLLQGPGGELGLLEALEPASQAPESPDAEASQPLRWRFERVELGQASLRGDLGGLEDLELELRDLLASGSVDAEAARFDLERVGLSASPLPALEELEGQLSGEGRLDLDTPEDAPLALLAQAQFSGTAGGIPVQARARYADAQLSGYLDAKSSPSSLERLWPGLALEDPVSLYVGFEGRLERLRVLTVLESGAGDLYARGHVSLTPQVSGQLSVVGRRLDAGGWLAELPESSVQLAAALRFELTERGFMGRLALRTWSTTWAGRALPDLALSTRLGGDAASGSLRVELPGATAELKAELSPLSPGEGGARKLAVQLDANVDDLARLSRELELGQQLRGQVQLDGQARIELEGMPSLENARITAELRNVSAGPVSMQRGTLELSAQGPLQAPRLGASLDARRVALPGYPIRRARLRAEGTLSELATQGLIQPENASPVRLRARIFPEQQLARDVELQTLEGGAASTGVRLSAGRIGRSPSGFEARDVELEGPMGGRLSLDGSVAGQRVRLEGSASDFAPVVLSRHLGIPIELPRGVADLDFNVDYRPGHLSGKLQGSVRRLCIGEELRGGKVDADLVVDDNAVNGSLAVRVPDLLQARLQADALELPARWEPSQLSKLTGELEIVAAANLAELQPSSRPDWLAPLTRGWVQARLLLAGQPGDAHPKMRLALSTRAVGAPGPLEVASVEPPGADPSAGALLQGMEVELVAELSDASLSASAVVLGPGGDLLADLQASTRVDVERLLRAPASIDPRELPIEVALNVPKRPLDALPLPSRFDGLSGLLGARVTATGTLGRPELAGQLELTRLGLDNGRTLPLTITADATLQGERLALKAGVRDEQRKLLSLDAQAQLSSGGEPPALEQLELDLRSNGLPLQSLGAVVGMDMAGELYGSLRVEDLGAKPTARGTLWINDLMLNGFRQSRARWVIQADASSFSTQLELRQPAGLATATASGPWRWQDQLVPELQPENTRFELEAKDFQLQALRAFLPEQARALSGRLDAAVTVAPGEERGAAGEIKLREGSIYVAALGQEFHDIQLETSISPTGAVKIDRLSARTLGGRLSAEGQAQLDGLMLRSAELVAEVPEGDPLPLMFEGVSVAEAWGRVRVDAQLESEAGPGQRRLNIGLSVPRFYVSLPEQSPHDVQELEDDPTISTGTYVEPDRFLSLPIPPYEEEGEAEPADAPLAVVIRVELGDEVWVERGTQLEVKLEGGLTLTLKDELTARGEIRLARGTIDVRGRIFEIERGVITFVEERAPSNPTVVATARYTAPEGTDVFADFVGPVETGNLSLRSEPPLRDDQILSLLLFGSPGGNFGASTGDGGGVGDAALAAGGSVVTQGLNQELRRFTALDIQTRIGENEGQPQPEVVVQITPRLAAELAYTLSSPNPGRAQDRTYLTLDLRLFRNWSLSTTIGNAGSLLVDLLWRYRY